MAQYPTQPLVNDVKVQNLEGIRILMLAPCLGKFGGIETFCLTLIEDLVNRGATVQLLRKRVKGFNSDGSIENSENEIRESWTMNESERFKSEFVNRYDRRVKKHFENCDLVHLHNPLAEGVWIAKRRKIPCVMTIYNWRRQGFHPRLLAWSWAVRIADRRWYISEFVWDSWESKRISDSARLPVVSRMPSKEIPCENRRGFLFVGRWIPNKGVRLLLKAYAKLDCDRAKWPLTIIGDGPLRSEIEMMIESLSIDGVRLPGFVSEKQRLQETSAAKWMITPPNTKEDLGLTPLEARSVGVPCIVSMDGGLVETGGPHALRCKPGCDGSLLACLRKAVQMNDAEYRKAAELAKVGIEDYVGPLSEYSKQYLELLDEKKH